MKPIQNIFKEDNYSLKEFYCNGSVEKNTERLKVEFVSENEIVIDVNMIGKNLPTYLEATFYLPKKTTGDLTIIAIQETMPALSCMELYTKPREIGRDIRIFMGKFSVTMPLIDDDKIKFKFTHYSNSNRAGRVRIKCI